MSGVFRGGVPIYPDLKRLLDRYATPDEGASIGYDDIASVIGASPSSSRFRTVVSAWRRALERPPHVRRLVAHPESRAYHVLAGDDHVRHAARKIDLSVRAAGRQVRSLSWIESSRLSEIGRAAHAVALAKGSAVLFARQRDARRLPETLPAPVTKKT